MPPDEPAGRPPSEAASPESPPSPLPRRARVRAPVADRKRTAVRRLQPALRERRHNRDLKPALPGMDDGVRQRAPHRRAARPHHSPCPYPGDERRELPAQAEPVTTPATVRITPRLTPWAHRPLPRAGRRQPRGGRIAPRAGPSRGLPGQAATEPVGHFCAAAPVHFYAAVDTSPRTYSPGDGDRVVDAQAEPAQDRRPRRREGRAHPHPLRFGLSGRRPVPPAGRAPRGLGTLTAGAPCPANPSPFNPKPRHYQPQIPAPQGAERQPTRA